MPYNPTNNAVKKRRNGMIKRIFSPIISILNQRKVAAMKKEQMRQLKRLGFGRGDEVRKRRQEKKQGRK